MEKQEFAEPNLSVARVGKSGFALRRLHSLLGVIPLGVFLIEHLVVNHFATRGEESFASAVEVLESLPFKIFLELGIIFLPLLFHAIYGVYIAFTSSVNSGKHSYFRNWMYVLQRVTGVLAFIFVVWHVFDTRIAAEFGAEVNMEMITDIISNPFMFAVYIIGILSAVFHFSNGLVTFAITWGLVVSPKSQKIASYVATVIFVVLSIIALQALFAFV